MNQRTAESSIWIQPVSENRKWEDVIFSLMNHFRAMPGWLCRQFDAMITWMTLAEYYEEATAAMRKLQENVSRYYGEQSAMQLIEEALTANQGVIAVTAGHDHLPQLPYHPCLRQSYFLIDQVKILIRTGKTDAAAEVYRKAWDVLREDADSYRIGTETFARTEFDRLELELLTACGDFEAAGQKADAMLDYARKWREEGHVYVLDLREQRADILTQLGRSREALSEYTDILCFLQKERAFRKEKIREIEQKIRKLLTFTVI